MTDDWQIVDHGIGKSVKDEMLEEMWTMMADMPADERSSLTASQRRVMITKAAANAWEKVKVMYSEIKEGESKSTIERIFDQLGASVGSRGAEPGVTVTFESLRKHNSDIPPGTVKEKFIIPVPIIQDYDPEREGGYAAEDVGDDQPAANDDNEDGDALDPDEPEEFEEDDPEEHGDMDASCSSEDECDEEGLVTYPTDELWRPIAMEDGISMREKVTLGTIISYCYVDVGEWSRGRVTREPMGDRAPNYPTHHWVKFINDNNEWPVLLDDDVYYDGDVGLWTLVKLANKSSEQARK